MKQNELFPKIRFKEFTNAWEQWKIGDMFQVGRGYVVPKKHISNNKFGEYIYPIYSSQTINNGLLGYYNNFLNSNSITWTTDGANAGTVYYRKGRFYATNVCGILSRKHFIPNLYLALSLSKVAYKHVTKVGNPKLMNNVMSSIELRITLSIDQQTKISSLFSNLDSLITLHQRKLILLKNTKNRLLEKMFCDEKSEFPSIRFKEFTNAWEQWKLSDIVQYKSSSMTSKDLIPYGKYDVYDPNRIAGKTNESPIEKEYISVVKDGDAGRIRLLPKNTMILSTMGALLASKGSNIEFIYFLLSNKNDLAKERNGSIIPHIYFRDYGQNLYNIPKSNEQSKISSLFSNLDSLITLHQRKLELLKNIKNTLLEKMFV
ncbi:restriction endonuclease subunit S [Mycoplasma capricolum]|uniref:restriction endonuclease subunit S n=1 Tax=Mycoplasma capricolum TaxID=2095 RepID=UPI001FB68221|nr:restriction endonuclease subunit S [Mycoplasma capricolum]